MFFGNKKMKAYEAEIARLEAFLSAMPGDYCGWSGLGEMAWSENFMRVLGLEDLKDVTDIYQALTPYDAAALEGHFSALRKKGDPFSYEAQTANQQKIIRFTGSRGRNMAQDTSFDILWVEDISELMSEKHELMVARDQAENSESYLRVILDTVPVPVWMSGVDGKLEWVNKTYADNFEMTRQRVIDDQKLISFSSKRGGSKASKEKKVKTLEALGKEAIALNMPQMQRSHAVISGKRRLLSSVVVPIEGRQAAVGIAQDITNQEEVEYAFRHYRENTKLLLEQLQSAVASFDEEEKLEFYNPEFSALWDIEEQWLNNNPKLGDIMERLREMRRLPEQVDFKGFKKEWVSRFKDLLEPFEELLHLPDNRTLRMLSIPRPAGGLIMIFEDVTSSLELESSYKTLMAVRRETLDNLAEGVSVFGGDGRLKLWNPNFSAMWNIDPENLEGEPHISKLIDRMQNCFPEDALEENTALIMRYALDRISQENQITLKDGTILLIYSVPLPDGGVMISYDDITDTVRVETALREKNAALEAAERLKLDFLANVSYQLRTPLNAIMGFAEILSNQYFGDLNDRQSEYTTGITDAGNRLLTLIDDILDLSTIEAGYLQLHTDTVDIKGMVENIYNLTQEWARKQSIQVQLDCSKTVGQIDADERRLKQALLNIIRNAITFTPEEGKITITAKRKRDRTVVITVADTGSGIPEDEQEKIFEPFERGSGGKVSNQGAGLGLSLVRNIVELHGGSVEIDSIVDKGTSVSLVLPPQKASAKAA